MRKLSFTKISAALIMSVFLSACDNSSDTQKAPQAGVTEQSKVEQAGSAEAQKDTQNTMESTTGSTESVGSITSSTPDTAYKHVAPETSTTQIQGIATESSSDPARENNQEIIEFTAYGAKPNWRAVIKDETLLLEGDDGIEEGTYKVKRSAYAKGVEYFGETEQHVFLLNIHAAECHDIAGHVTDFMVTFIYGKKELKGCAVANAIERQ